MNNTNWIQYYKQEVMPRKFQQGGPVPAEAMAPPPEAGGAGGGAGDPTAQLEQLLMQYSQTHDPQLAVQIADLLLTLMGGGGAAAPGPEAGAAPAGPPMARRGMNVPVFRK
jgi:hypothetical protein